MGKARLDEQRLCFDKWQMYRLLYDEPIGPCLIPKTAPLTTYSLHTFLRRFQQVYVKPTGTWGGSNISLVDGTQSPATPLWTVQGERPRSVHPNQVIRHYQGVPAIVQQAIPALRFENCPCDIRVHFQRDMDGTWVYAGELVRVGGNGSGSGNGIVSNVEISHGKVLPLADAIKELFPNGTIEPDRMTHQLNEIGMGICRLFEDYSHIDEVGIDLALDANQQFWLIEVNTNDALGAPSHELFRALPDLTTYNEMEQRTKSRSLGVIEFFFELLEEDLAEERRLKDAQSDEDSLEEGHA